MIKNIFKFKVYILIITCITFTACKKNYIDPNRVSPDNALTTDRGLTYSVVGLQRSYTSGREGSLYNSFSINGLITNELFVINSGNAAEVQLQAGGGSVDPTNSMLRNYWASNNEIIGRANLIINNAAKLADKSYASGIIGYASIFKALCLGNLAMYWEKVPDTIGLNVNFSPRIEGFKKAVKTLDYAITYLNANPINPVFRRSLPSNELDADKNPIPAIDIKNTLYALKARYALFARDSITALIATDSVDLSKKSTFIFEAATPNPIANTATASNNVVQVIDSTFGLPAADTLPPALNDGRIGFYTTIAASPRYRIKGFGATNSTPVPLYLPGEIILIRAEAYARQGNTTAALNELNRVLTKTTDIYGLGANQPALVGPLSKEQILKQVYRNRCIELYMSGLKLEDMRRFNRDVSERRRNFMPYPFTERDNNPNNPPNPAF